MIYKETYFTAMEEQTTEDQEEFEEFIEEQRKSSFLGRHWITSNEKSLMQMTWLEKGRRDKATVMQAVDHVLSYDLPYLAEKRLRELLEEMK